MYFSSRFTRDDLDNSFEIHTYEDLYLIPTSRPVIQPPKPKQTAVDISGANGSTDLSRSLTGYPVFMNRQGSNEYMIENDRWPKWIDAQTEITNKLNGQYLRMYFEDDEPEYYYIGTWSVTNWTSGEIYSTINIEYDLFPYKMRDYPTGSDDQLWDTFNFNKDYIFTTTAGERRMFYGTLNSSNQNVTLFDSYDSLIRNDLVNVFGEMPITPKITVANNNGYNDWRIKLVFQNDELDISAETVLSGTAGLNNIDIPDFIMTMFNPQKETGSSVLPTQRLSLTAQWLEGDVNVSVNFIIGRL